MGMVQAAVESLVEDTLSHHVVVVGCGRVGSHIVTVARNLDSPHLVIDSHLERVEALTGQGTAALYGDAANSEILTHAGLARAQALIVTLPQQSDAELVVSASASAGPATPHHRPRGATPKGSCDSQS